MRRYWFDHLVLDQKTYLIEGELFKHIHKVCRQNLGDRFELIGSQGTAILVEVIYAEKKLLKVKYVSKRNLSLLKPPYIHLMLSIPKVKTFEAIVEKSVELGVYSLQAFTSEFSFIKSQNKIEDRRERLNKIIRSACEQSARSHILCLPEVQTFSELLEIYKFSSNPQTQAFAFYEGQASPLKELDLVLDPILTSHYSSLNHLWVFIGSEGGFSCDEVEAFKRVQIPFFH